MFCTICLIRAQDFGRWRRQLNLAVTCRRGFMGPKTTSGSPEGLTRSAKNSALELTNACLLHLSKLPTALVYLATKLVYGPLNRSAGGSAVARHLFYNDYLNAISKFGWREQHTIVFDHLVAPTSHYIRREEFEEWWRDVEAKEVAIGWHNKNSWRGFGHDRALNFVLRAWSFEVEYRNSATRKQMTICQVQNTKFQVTAFRFLYYSLFTIYYSPRP